MFGMTKGGVRIPCTRQITINNWPLTIKLRQAFSPQPRGVPCFPTLRFATHWAELLRPFRALFQWLIVNCHAGYMIRRVPRITINHWPLTIELCYAGYTVSERRGTSPQPPPFKGGNAVRSAISKQRAVCRVGANLVFAPFCVVLGLSERRGHPNANGANQRCTHRRDAINCVSTPCTWLDNWQWLCCNG